MWCHNDASFTTVEVSSSCLASLQNKHNSSSCRVVCGLRTFDASVRCGNGFFMALYDVSLRHEANHWQNNLANRCSKPLARLVSRLSTSFHANRFKFRAHFANLEFVLYVGVVNAESANSNKVHLTDCASAVWIYTPSLFYLLNAKRLAHISSQGMAVLLPQPL